jgi:hypothetical protein
MFRLRRLSKSKAEQSHQPMKEHIVIEGKFSKKIPDCFGWVLNENDYQMRMTIK